MYLCIDVVRYGFILVAYYDNRETFLLIFKYHLIITFTLCGFCIGTSAVNLFFKKNWTLEKLRAEFKVKHQ